MNDLEYIKIKTLLIGNSAVGKSCILSRYDNEGFVTNFLPTIGVDFKCKTFEMDGTKIKLYIWDTAGQEKFCMLTSSYYRGTDGVIFVYDVSNRKSFEQVEWWIDQVNKKRYSSRTISGDIETLSEVTTILVANKCDITESHRQVTEFEGVELAKKYRMRYIETSAKNGNGIDELFQQHISDLYDRVIVKEGRLCSADYEKINLDKANDSIKEKCCAIF